MADRRFTNTTAVRQLVLASSSPRRRELVGMLGLSLPVLVLSPDSDESTPADWSPVRIVEQLALRKARAARTLLPNSADRESVIVGADTIVVLRGEVMGKPVDVAEAHRMLSGLQGTEHEVYTGVACIHARDESQESVSHRLTRVTMKTLDDAAIHRYIATGEPMDKAGSYGIQGRGGVLVERIDGCYFNVVGLPVSLLSDMLAEFGVDVL
ncbi:septum formation protein [Paenibacillus phyllosphaerae]|uniref:dTTP/UTP pyrophosphatase n=1 Tax=Paenibacillus phyllosphaerae TaxID=274593 RepID=A0A7W5AWD4_9BACL|nr:Maf family protein [Paenibacillus phyllosphaerae]MBB3109897.1 septum formation protein [Paenibacillus phyllosphaerae]